MRSVTMVAGLALTVAMAASAQSQEIYIYKEGDGTRWFTDRKIHQRGFKLIGTYGRPTATRSCLNMTPQRLADRARPFLPVIKRYADQHRLDESLVHAVITVESCFDQNAVSTAGAQGLMQLMPGTARDLAVHNAFSPSENIRGGTSYLRRMIDRFDDNLELALAAYNAGPAAVERHGGIPPFPETQQYVVKVMQHYERYSAKSPWQQGALSGDSTQNR